MSAYCCVNLDLFLLTLNHDARNHELKKTLFFITFNTHMVPQECRTHEIEKVTLNYENKS